MSRFKRLDVLNTMLSTGIVPLYYNKDVELVKKLLKLATKAVRGCSNSPTAAITHTKCLPK